MLTEANRYYRSASVGVARLPLRAAWSIATARGVYRDIGSLVLRQGEAAWDQRAYVSKPRKLMRVAGAGLETLVLAGLRPSGKRYSREGLWNRPEPGSGA
jgi:phytoene synthase